ncbi:MAG: M3 family oligoendopeptidase [Candidatus Omnitrophica bacterium]|nr:M3 family oligoendopeptidase [Candidatus Omnitrophota bacterium]MCB9746979.1 M3 family oligoendopeptidase [Candidatus Omnitrophota bacterium]
MTTASTPQLDFSNLKPYKARKFIPTGTNFDHLEDVVKLFQQILTYEINTPKDFQLWLENRSELEAAIDQHGAILYIRMTCQTDDKARAEAYKNFIEKIVPAIKPIEDKINRKLLEESKRFSLDQDRYHVYLRGVENDVKLFVQENVELQTKVSLLSQEYQTICAAMTVQFQGEEKTLPQMSKFLLEPDRALREEAWRATSKRRLEDQAKLDDIFDKMVKLRHQTAINAKCANFCEYKFKSMHRFDYTPGDCKTYHQTIEKIVLPIWTKILKRRKEQMKLDTLKPWDSAVDPLGRPPLKPFDQVAQLISGCREIFTHVDPELGQAFQHMMDLGVLDLASRKGKAPGGYQSTLNEARKPFIFMNAVGVHGDVSTLLHEGGHAFHALACAHDPLVDYRHAPMEFCEVASMAMELLGGHYLSAFYNDDEQKRAIQSHLEDIVYILIWVATIDAFQHWIYENPEHTAEQRVRAWLDVRKRFDSDLVSWEGLTQEHSYLWHRQLHIFEVPFYYIEYGIAQLGALGVWFNAKKNWKEGVKKYRDALALGGSKPLPVLFETAGIRFDFSEKTIAPLMEAVEKELSAMYE